MTLGTALSAIREAVASAHESLASLARRWPGAAAAVRDLQVRLKAEPRS